jgi:hypothetical protein
MHCPDCFDVDDLLRQGIWKKGDYPLFMMSRPTFFGRGVNASSINPLVETVARIHASVRKRGWIVASAYADTYTMSDFEGVPVL